MMKKSTAQIFSTRSDKEKQVEIQEELVLGEVKTTRWHMNLKPSQKYCGWFVKYFRW